MNPALSLRTERGPCSRTHPPAQPTTAATPATARNPAATPPPEWPDGPPPEWPDADLPGTGQPGAVYPDAGSQGLFLSVPAGSFDADRFAQSGPAGEMPPDPLLATIIDAVTGPDGPGPAACLMIS